MFKQVDELTPFVLFFIWTADKARKKTYFNNPMWPGRHASINPLLFMFALVGSLSTLQFIFQLLWLKSSRSLKNDIRGPFIIYTVFR